MAGMYGSRLGGVDRGQALQRRDINRLAFATGDDAIHVCQHEPQRVGGQRFAQGQPLDGQLAQ